MTELPELLGRLGALAGQLGMTAEELADAVLLAAAGYEGDAAASGSPVDDTCTDSALPGAQHEDVPQTAVHSREQSAGGGHKVSAYGSANGYTQPGERLTLGQAAALPQALAIGRALRPLRRRWQHGHRTELHIDATVEDYARTGLLVPHLVPMPERWLDVTVVLDRSSSMSVWDPALDGLNRILRSLGALRTLNTWHLTWSGADPVLRDQRGALVPLGQAGCREGQPGRRLMLVLSDCAAPGWRGGTLWKHLHVWSRTTSLALFNPLPPRLWHRTALDLPLTITTAPEPVAPSGSWGYEPKQPRRWRRESSIRSWNAVPVIGTEPEDLRRWAQTLMRSDPEGCTAVLIPDTGRPPQRAPRRPSAVRAVTPAPKPAARAEAFLQTARTPATQLAIHASALDTFTLPILHALREQAVSEARLDDLAELLTADLCTVRRYPEADDLYTFRPEALAHLRQKLTRQAAWRTHQALTRHIASRPWTPDGLAAVLHTATGARLPTALVPFAEAADSVLRQLGVTVPTSLATGPDAIPGPGLPPRPSAHPVPPEPESSLLDALQARLRQVLQSAPQDWLAKIGLLESLSTEYVQLLGDSHPATLTACAHLAASYYEAGRIDEAIAIELRVLAGREEILGERHPDTLFARASLAASYHQVGRTADATALRERVLAGREEILGERHPDTLSARADLAASYHQAGRIDEAIAIATRVLADREEILGERHPNTLSARANLATAYHQVGRTADATALRERVLADREEILGERHPDTLSARANLAASFYEAGRIDEAIAIELRVLADREEILGEYHPDTLSARANLAASFYEAGRLGEAIGLEERVLLDSMSVLGERHPDTLSARASLAASYHRVGRAVEATAMRERVLADREEILGERHPATLLARANLAHSYYEAGRTDEAIAIQLRVLADREEILGERHPDTLSARAELAASYHQAGRTAEAAAIREQVLVDREENHAVRGADTAQPVGAISVGAQPTASISENPAEPAADHGAEVASDSEVFVSAAPDQHRSRTRGRASPYFFLSYARTPAYGGETAPDMWVERLFHDLCGHVMAMTDLSAGSVAGFMDREILPGDNWSNRLSEMLAECRVFVPLFSPRYFSSEMCGKEWHAFEQRAIHHGARSGRPAEAIVPALWVPVPPSKLPPAAQRLQFNHRYFGERYVSDGLYGLIKLRRYAQEYERAVYELAKRIVMVAENVRLGPGRSRDLHLVRSAFDPSNSVSEDCNSIQITVVAPTRRKLPEGRTPEYYGGSAQDWNPYYPASTRSLAHVTEDLVRSLNYQAVITSFDVESGRPGGRRQPDTPEILLIDPWALQDEERRHKLAASDAINQPWTTVIVPGNRDDRQSQAAKAELTEQLEQTMPATMSRGRSSAYAGPRGVPTLEAFGQILPQAVEAAVREYRRHTMAQPPVD
ncbi:TIR-like protein FxsC [Streptomyces parvus]|uniref:TIR-like protein FxsC n=1 Tax=Streptomyces parvus TaxID=66428 RepID=UPI0033F45F6D